MMNYRMSRQWNFDAAIKPGAHKQIVIGKWQCRGDPLYSLLLGFMLHRDWGARWQFCAWCTQHSRPWPEHISWWALSLRERPGTLGSHRWSHRSNTEGPFPRRWHRLPPEYIFKWDVQPEHVPWSVQLLPSVLVALGLVPSTSYSRCSGTLL